MKEGQKNITLGVFGIISSIVFLGVTYLTIAAKSYYYLIIPLVIAILSIISAVYSFKGKNWAKIASIILFVLALLATALVIYALTLPTAILTNSNYSQL